MVDISNYFERSLALLASQFQLQNPDGSFTNFQLVIQALIAQAQVINTQQQLLQTMRYLNTAEGVQLDGLGQILGLERMSGQSDSSYREDLQFQIFVNQSAGTPEQIIYIIKFLTEATTIWYMENIPAGYQLTTDGIYGLDSVIYPNADPSSLIQVLQSVSPAGVLFVALIATYNTNPFSFSSDPITEQFYVAPDPDDITQVNPLEVNPGSGAVDLFIQRGQTVNPNFGGGFSEALGQYPDYTIDTTGAGQLSESIQTNGNLPPS